MVKRIPFVLLTLVLALAFGSLPASAAKIPLKVASTEGDTQSINLAKQAVADYQTLHPDVEISFENIPTDQITRRALAAAAAGDTLGVQLTWAHLAYETVIKGLMEPVDGGRSWRSTPLPASDSTAGTSRCSCTTPTPWP